MKYRIDFSYDGTNFHGFQSQPKYRTVQQAIEDALTFINNKKKVKIYGSGRTDKGVHAINQVAHFEIDKDIPCYKLKCGLNSNLDEDIHINCVKKVSDKFNARFNVVKKEYLYKINISEYNPIERNYCFQYNKKIDINKIIEAKKYLIGTHDFTSLVSSEDKREDKVRTIYDIKIRIKNNILYLSFIGDGFMKYQIRNMVGLLISISEGKKDVNEINDILNNKNRNQHFKTAPACGLYLKKVYYR